MTIKIIPFDIIKEKINTYDEMANVDMTKPNSIFPQKSDKSFAEKMQKFFDIADGNPDWNY